MERRSTLCYNSNMSNILLIGKDLPDCIDFAEGIVADNNVLYASAKTEADENKFETERIFSSVWNKASAISAHSFAIKAENKLTTIDNIIFYFDASYYCSKYELDKTEEISIGVDTMISSYLYSVSEILKRIDQRKEKITVTFLLKEYPSKAETTLNPKIQTSAYASTIVTAAQSAFAAMAEDFAINVADREYLSVILGKCQISNEIYKNEKLIGAWCVESFNAMQALKAPQTVKAAAAWNKVGTKIQTGFSLFNR